MVAIWSVHHKTWQVIYYCALVAEQMPGTELRYGERAEQLQQSIFSGGFIFAPLSAKN